MEKRNLTADELRQIASIMDNPELPDGTEHNPDLLVRPHIFATPDGEWTTLEVYL